jgi:hypothetical protein
MKDGTLVRVSILKTSAVRGQVAPELRELIFVKKSKMAC